jgi:hypothetical protein
MDIFNRSVIYDTIFFNIQSVTEYGDITDFKKEEPEKYATWERMARKRYRDELLEGITLNSLYLEKACFLPEFSKIVAISYATVKAEDGELKRELKRIKGEFEGDIVIEFMNVLNQKYSEGHNAKPSYIPTLCGHNIIGHDIPLLIKRIIKYREPLKATESLHIIPPILKHFLKAKPWESNVIDTVQTWKFNGSDFISLNLVSDFMGLKKSVRLMPKDEINKMYWAGIEDDAGSTMKEINDQSVNFTNIALQLVNELRQL